MLQHQTTGIADELAGRANDIASELAKTNYMAAGSDAMSTSVLTFLIFPRSYSEPKSASGNVNLARL